MDHKVQPRQVNAACGHIGGNADPRTPVAQGLQRMGAFLLGKFARQRHNLKAPVAHAGKQMVHVDPRLAEDDGCPRLVIAQDVEDRMFAVARADVQRAVFDVDMLARLALRLDAQRIALEILGQRRDCGGHGGREHHGPAFGRGGGQDVFQVFAEAQIQHLVGFVQHGGAQTRQVQRAAVDMVAQPARRADHDMGAPVQRALFRAVVHAADTGRDLRPGLGVKPVQFAGDLQGKLARWCDDQRHRHIGKQQPVGTAQKIGGNGHAEGHGLARSGLGADQRIPARNLGGQHCLLDGGEGFITPGRQRRSQRRGNRIVVHSVSALKGGTAKVPEGRRPFPFATGPPRPDRPGCSEPWRSAYAEYLHLYSPAGQRGPTDLCLKPPVSLR